MQQSTVKFKIAPGGQINMEVIGGAGESCVDVTKELEVSLMNAGSRQVDEGKKPEYYEPDTGLNAFNDLLGEN